MNNIAIIPARSGSKGLKDKNIKLLYGKPLMAYTIEAALESMVFDKVIVSTDSQEYAEIAMKYGATVPFLRSTLLAGDKVPTYEVIVDLIDKLKKDEFEYNNLMILQPTSPLRTSEDIKKSLDLFMEKNANAVVSVCETEHSPLHTGTIPTDLRIDGFIKKDVGCRRQDLPKYYRLNGAIYLTKVEYFLEYQDFYKKNCFAYVMDKQKSIDIDDMVDFIQAEGIIKNNVMINSYPKLRKNQEPQPNAYFKSKVNLKAIVVGCDPSTEDQNITFKTVFDIENPKYKGDFRKNPYFREIMSNLIWVLEDNPKTLGEDYMASNIYKQIYVQNLCPNYLEHSTGYYKTKWVDWIRDDINGAGYIKGLRKELDNFDPQRKLPVLLTSSYLLDALRDEKKIKGDARKFKLYYNGNKGFIGKDENELGRILIPFSRSKQAGYMLQEKKNMDYRIKIRNYLLNYL